MTVPVSYRLLKQQHLRKPGEFAAVYERQQRAGDGHLLVFALQNTLGYSRFGLSVSKKHGNAVRRSRLKRLLREAFRLGQHDLPAGWDWVLIPRQNSGAILADYQASLCRLTEKIARRANDLGAANTSSPGSTARPRSRR